jgi:hypothetical protein
MLARKLRAASNRGGPVCDGVRPLYGVTVGEKCMGLSTELLKLIERRTGESIKDLQRETIDDRRYKIEKKLARPVEFKSCFPYIGRGSVMRAEKIVSHAEVEQRLRKAIG